MDYTRRPFLPLLLLPYARNVTWNSMPLLFLPPPPALLSCDRHRKFCTDDDMHDVLRISNNRETPLWRNGGKLVVLHNFWMRRVNDKCFGFPAALWEATSLFSKTFSPPRDNFLWRVARVISGRIFKKKKNYHGRKDARIEKSDVKLTAPSFLEGLNERPLEQTRSCHFEAWLSASIIVWNSPLM